HPVLPQHSPDPDHDRQIARGAGEPPGVAQHPFRRVRQLRFVHDGPPLHPRRGYRSDAENVDPSAVGVTDASAKVGMSEIEADDGNGWGHPKSLPLDRFLDYSTDRSRSLAGKSARGAILWRDPHDRRSE